MDKKELSRKYNLASSDVYQAIRAEALNFIVKMSVSALTPEKLQGMLMLIREIDSWVTDYEKELLKRKEI
ncbi:MAG: hypothetical protein LUH11_02950 [Candidatus Gastranaerophilales bacterium]|nr:hypothetical protein [Candidatus Gastranaerophilales bacterium]